MKTGPSLHPQPFDPVDRRLPLQQQLVAEMRAELADGLWVGRRDFYTEKELSERFDVSPITARAVLDKLAEEGWISRGRGRRSFPLRGPQEISESAGTPLVTPTNEASFQYSLHSAGVRIAPAEACRAFGIPLGSELWQCLRLRCLDGQMHSVTHNAQLTDTGEKHDIAGLQSRSMIDLLRLQGEHVSVLKRRISAVSPPQQIAMLLDMKLNTPTLLYTCTLHRRDGSIIEWLRVFMRTDHVPASEAFDLDQATWLNLNRP